MIISIITITYILDHVYYCGDFLNMGMLPLEYWMIIYILYVYAYISIYTYIYIYTYPMRYIGYIDANPTAEINSLLEGGDHGRQHDA